MRVTREELVLLKKAQMSADPYGQHQAMQELDGARGSRVRESLKETEVQ